MEKTVHNPPDMAGAMMVNNAPKVSPSPVTMPMLCASALLLITIIDPAKVIHPRQDRTILSNNKVPNLTLGSPSLSHPTIGAATHRGIEIKNPTRMPCKGPKERANFGMAMIVNVRMQRPVIPPTIPIVFGL